MKNAPKAKPAISVEVCALAMVRLMPYASCKKGTAHKPPKANSEPAMPKLTTKPGQVARFFSTVLSPSNQCPVWGAWAACPSNSRKLFMPMSCGWLRTNQAAKPAKRIDTSPIATNTLRHEATPSKALKGAVASTEPTLPSNIVTPVMVAKCRS